MYKIQIIDKKLIYVKIIHIYLTYLGHMYKTLSFSSLFSSQTISLKKFIFISST